jgi:ankyrin repeat protein
VLHRSLHFALQRNETAIIQASYKGHDAVVQLLAASGANVNVKDNVRTAGTTANDSSATENPLTVLCCNLDL